MNEQLNEWIDRNKQMNNKYNTWSEKRKNCKVESIDVPKTEVKKKKKKKREK